MFSFMYWEIISLFIFIFGCLGFLVLFCYIVFLFFFNRCQCIACFGKLFAFIFRFCNLFEIIVNNFCFIIEGDKVQASSFMGAFFAVAFFGIVCQGMLGDLFGHLSHYLTTTLPTSVEYDPGLKDQVLLEMAKHNMEIPPKSVYTSIPIWDDGKGYKDSLTLATWVPVNKRVCTGATYVFDPADGVFFRLQCDPRDGFFYDPTAIYFLSRVENLMVLPCRIMRCNLGTTVGIYPPYFKILTVLPQRWTDYGFYTIFNVLHYHLPSDLCVY